MKVSNLGDKWFLIYRKCLESFSVTNAIRIAYYYRPKKLYKYFVFDKHWKDNVQNGTIVFNSANNFNDPLDSRWYLDYEKILKNRMRDIGSSTDIVEELLTYNGKKNYTLLEEDMLYLYDTFRISCFSETPCSNVMWGHYADKHKGFCLEYDVDKLTKKLKPLMPVIYTDKPFDASDIIDMRGIDDKFAMFCPALFKSKDWSYEKEWRILMPKSEADIKLYNIPDAITGVFLGFKTLSSGDADELENLANQMNVPVYRMERSYLSYDLVYSSISDLKCGNSEGFLV